MTLLVGYHFQEDSYPGPPLGAATFLDVGGQQAAATFSERLCRVYFTGRPDPAWLAGKLAEPPAAGERNVVGNEPNLAQEGFGGGPADYAAWFVRVAAAAPAETRLYYAGMSPGVPGWQEWYSDPVAREAIDVADGLCVHAYGDLAEMQETVRWIVEQFPGKPLWIGEFNFGAGRSIPDVDAWVNANVPPFLDWLAGIPQVEAATWFSWFWDQSASLPTSIDAKGTAVADVLGAWVPRPPMNGGSGEEWYAPAIARPISCNYTPGRAAPAVLAVVEHIADGYGSPFGWFDQDRGASGSSAHFWISRTGVVEQYRPLSDTCWANGPICDPDDGTAAVTAIVESRLDPNAQTVAVEHEGVPGEAFTPEQTAASAELTAWLCDLYGLPRSREWVIAHGQLDSCNRAYCPGSSFPWAAVLGEEPPPAYDIDAARDRVWALADEVEAAGWPWYGQSLKAATALSKQEK